MKKDDEKEQKESFNKLNDEEKIEALIASLEEEDKEKASSDDSKDIKESEKHTKKILNSNQDKKAPLKKPKPKTKKKNALIMIRLGGAFHSNFIVNLILTYFINLTLIMTLTTLLVLGSFPSALWVPLLFTLIYTITEYLSRELIMLNYMSLVLKSFGTLLYLVYVTLFYVIDQFVFSGYQIFNGEAEVAAFTGLFMIIRYLSTYVVKKGLEFKL